MVYYSPDNDPDFLRDLPDGVEGEELWRAVKAQVEGRVRIAGSLVRALGGARDFFQACEKVNKLFLPLIERFPETEIFEQLRLFLIHQVAGEFAFGFTRRFARNYGLRFTAVERRRLRKGRRRGWGGRLRGT